MDQKQGTVKRVLDAGYGFIFHEDVAQDIFFHLENWRSGEPPVVGQKVTFEFAPGKSGKRDQAVSVRPVDATAGIAALSRLAAPTSGGVQ